MTAEVTSYTELIAVIRLQVGVLGVRYEDFDALADFPAGLTGKAFGGLQVKRLGPEKLFDALRSAGLRLKVEEDPEQLEKMRKRIAENFLPRQANQARMGNHASPVSSHMMSRVFKHFSRMGVKARMRKMTPAQRKAHARHAANQRWRQHRKRLKAASRRRNRLAAQKDAEA